MAADRESSFRLSFDGSDNTLRSFVAQMKSQLRSDVADLEAITSRVELFRGAQQRLADTEAAGRKATQALVDIQQKIDLLAASGGKVDDALTKAFNAATKSAQQVSKEQALVRIGQNPKPIRTRLPPLKTQQTSALL